MWERVGNWKQDQVEWQTGENPRGKKNEQKHVALVVGVKGACVCGVILQKLPEIYFEEVEILSGFNVSVLQ